MKKIDINKKGSRRLHNLPTVEGLSVAVNRPNLPTSHESGTPSTGDRFDRKQMVLKPEFVELDSP